MEASCSGKARRSFRREGWRARQRGSKTGLQATGPAEAGPARPAIKRARKGDTDKKSRESVSADVKLTHLGEDGGFCRRC